MEICPTLECREVKKMEESPAIVAQPYSGSEKIVMSIILVAFLIFAVGGTVRGAAERFTGVVNQYVLPTCTPLNYPTSN